jgi:outer membrane protein OmpA-like peptidoglycan-associated protein
MTHRRLLLAATALALPVAAAAQPVSGLYVGAGAGYNYLQNQDLKSYSTPGPLGRGGTFLPLPGAHFTGTGGPVGSLSLGYGLGNGLRVELQGDWRAQHDTFDHGVGGSRFGGADLQTFGGFANALYDLDLGLPLVPYLGAGVGYEETFGHNFRLYSPGAQYDVGNNDQGSIAAQGILGLSYPLAVLPGLSLTAEYRFMYAADQETFHGTFTSAFGNAPATVKIASQFNHAGLFGLRYVFNAPSPPPPPAPAPATAPVAQPARTYLVFFDWDRADLTARARQIIGEAVANATHVQLTRIVVNGYTDLSGSPAYNQKLSIRRAESVAAELVRDGVPRSEITTQGFGETHPLVPTAQGVREPQNRRVEILLK